jgi:hypothetical protein
MLVSSPIHDLLFELILWQITVCLIVKVSRPVDLYYEFLIGEIHI